MLGKKLSGADNTSVVAFFLFSAGVGNLHHHLKRLKGLSRHIFHVFQHLTTITSIKDIPSFRESIRNLETGGESFSSMCTQFAVYTKLFSFFRYFPKHLHFTLFFFAKPIDSSGKECFHILYTSFWITHFVTRIKTLCYIDFVLLMQLIVP